MRKIFGLTVLLFVSVALVGCSGDKPNPQNNRKTTSTQTNTSDGKYSLVNSKIVFAFDNDSVDLKRGKVLELSNLQGRGVVGPIAIAYKDGKKSQKCGVNPLFLADSLREAMKQGYPEPQMGKTGMTIQIVSGSKDFTSIDFENLETAQNDKIFGTTVKKALRIFQTQCF